MFRDITWGILLDVTTKEKAQRVINRLANVIGEIEVLSLEQYWKDQSKYKLDCYTTLQIAEPENAVFKTLHLVSKLGGEISVIGPHILNGNQVEFEGIGSSPTIVGVSWFSFYICNY
ncbi:hypothetical protein PU629_19340 [Pullulanibacillus sp. KACC 23026]|uniref:hypothetical protein n=1 Tax=Pullulanibacillus sp. KACC 23026 TaxID=3028315 RepID=UPI0023B0C7A8|nr:hypothetical protein [Pullulanibacillus sp. KACC 23026]WEG12248.1 hypothetical protein PU629_19340 [Pullulanibacillus sp. KACC 23026]